MGDLTRHIDPESTVHVCLDMQRLFGPGAPWATPWLERVLPLIVPLVEHAPARTIFTRFIPPPTPAQARGMWRPYFEKWAEVTLAEIDPSMLELMPALQRYAPPATVIDKPAYSAFSASEFLPLLIAKRVTTLIITGAETDVCVLATILGAVDQGFRVIVARDALCSSADESHDALLNLYRNRFDIQVELATTTEVLDKWHPA